MTRNKIDWEKVRTSLFLGRNATVNRAGTDFGL